MPIRAAPRRASASTLPEAVTIAQLRAARWGRRAIIALLALFLLLGVFNVFGVRQAAVSDTAGEWTLAVDYAAVSRAGLSTPLAVRVRRAGGFGAQPIVLAVERRYLLLFTGVRLEPPPISATASAELVTWTFAPPDGDTLHVDVDARIDPSVHAGAPGSIAVMQGGRRAVSVAYRTRIMP